MNRNLFGYLLLTLVLDLFLVGAAHAATLRIGAEHGNPGEVTAVPILLETGAEPAPAALAFDITYESRVFTCVGVNSGPAADAAGKILDFEVYPGGVRVLIGEVNESPIGDGLLAMVQIRTGDTLLAKPVMPLAGGNGLAAAADASAVPLILEEGHIELELERMPVLGAGTLLGLLLCGMGLAFRRRKRPSRTENACSAL